MNKAEWLNVLKVQTSCLNDGLKAFLKDNRECMVAWCNGEPIEMKMGKDPHIQWYGVREDKLSASKGVQFRIPPKVTIVTTLTVKQANALYRVLEENTFHTDGGQKARNSVMRSIEEELKKVDLK